MTIPDYFRQYLRTEANQRLYTDEHIDRLQAIHCFKRTGLSLAKMHEFFEYSKDLPAHIDDIIRMMEDHEKNVICQMEKLQQDLKHIHQKVHYLISRYRTPLSPSARFLSLICCLASFISSSLYISYKSSYAVL